jgi:hypothetical protein
MKEITSRHRLAVDLVLNENKTMASVGREFGVTARTVRRWIDAIYPRPPSQDMKDMYGYSFHIGHSHGSLFPQKYDDLNSEEKRKLREQYIEWFNGRCLYCEEMLEDEPHKFVRQSADDIEWDDLHGGKEGFLSNPVHLHHDHETGLTLAPLHALCNAHSWHFNEAPASINRFVNKNESMSVKERDEFAARMRERFS